jgi:signal transduction histidine kinase
MEGVNSMLLGVSLLAVLLLSLISWFVSRSIARPLESASRAAARIAGGEMGTRLAAAPKRFARELTTLTESFNGMADALEFKERLRTRMTSDIAHELRTPVSILKAHLEGVRDEVLAMDAAQVSSLLEETMRLEKIINDLRSIWELENAQPQLCCTELEVEPFMQRALERFRPLADEKGMRLVLQFQEPGLRVLADFTAIQRVFDNLMQNALKYGREHGAIEIKVCREAPARDAKERKGEWVRLCVTDDGPGISEAALPMVFERFYRADEARARTGTTSGAGLGLAIAREAVEACGGSITAANRTDAPGVTGAVFTVFLPAP